MKIKNLFLVSVLCLFGAEVVAQENLSLGTNSFNGAAKFTTAIGTNAGQYNNLDPNPSLTFSYGANNTYLGYNAGKGTSAPQNTSFSNTFVGYNSGTIISTGQLNTFIGSESGTNCTNCSANVFIGRLAGRGGIDNSSLEAPSNNVIIGNEAGLTIGKSGNVYIGAFAGKGSGTVATSGRLNTYLGFECGKDMVSGEYNTFIGRVNLPTSVSANLNLTPGSNSNNTIILGDGYTNQRLYIHSNGFAGIGLGNNVIPKSMLEIKGFSSGAQLTPSPSGLRLTNLPNTAASTTNLTNKVLSVNATGDVILVDDKQATNGVVGVTSTCAVVNFVPKSADTTGNLTCSQIFDNGTSVGIGYSTASIATTAFSDATLPGTWTAPGTTPASPGVTYKLAVNGVTKASAFYSTSDKRFKKDIKPIENALKTIEAIEGKTYLWNKEANKEMNFDNGDHSGFIAQDLEKVLPHLVASGQDGSKAVNYIELMPYLVEAIKEQQTQINELKAQISNNFKTQNQDLLQFENTKIISVSPNPSSDVILVSLNIEKAVTTANLQVHDLNGTLLSSLNLKERDTNIIKSLQKDNFGKGIYIVSLIVNGKSIDTKKIIFN